jgi:hypothetical protein
MPIISWLIMGAVTAVGGILARIGWRKATKGHKGLEDTSTES